MLIDRLPSEECAEPITVLPEYVWMVDNMNMVEPSADRVYEDFAEPAGSKIILEFSLY